MQRARLAPRPTALVAVFVAVFVALTPRHALGMNDLSMQRESACQGTGLPEESEVG